jgi:hypothetical protein
MQEKFEEKRLLVRVLRGEDGGFRRFLYVRFNSSFRILETDKLNFICSQINDYIRTCSNCFRDCGRKGFWCDEGFRSEDY